MTGIGAITADGNISFTAASIALGNGATDAIDISGDVTIGDGAGYDVAIDSNTWDVNAAGVASGLTGITSTGAVDFSGATTLEIPQGADLACAAAGDVGRIFFDTDDGIAKICTNDANADGVDDDYALEALN